MLSFLLFFQFSTGSLFQTIYLFKLSFFFLFGSLIKLLVLVLNLMLPLLFSFPTASIPNSFLQSLDTIIILLWSGLLDSMINFVTTRTTARPAALCTVPVDQVQYLPVRSVIVWLPRLQLCYTSMIGFIYNLSTKRYVVSSVTSTGTLPYGYQHGSYSSIATRTVDLTYWHCYSEWYQVPGTCTATWNGTWYQVLVLVRSFYSYQYQLVDQGPLPLCVEPTGLLPGPVDTYIPVL